VLVNQLSLGDDWFEVDVLFHALFLC
jgi:hypothetical protein